MINLLLLYDQKNTTTEANISGTVSIYDDGNHSFRIKKSSMVTADDLNWCDACFANRPSSVYMVRIGKALKRSGRLFMVFYDDDLLDLPKGNSGRWKKNYVKRSIKMADIVITVNPLLKSLYEQISYTSKFVNIDTHIREEEIKAIPKKDDKVRIVYAAGRDHTELFNLLIKPFLDKLAEKYRMKIDMTLMGVDPDLSDLKHQGWIHKIATMPYDEYNEFMNSHDFDIGLAPLLDTSFSNKKYFNKFFEYAKNGIAGIYSNHLPYTFIIRNGENGILVENKVEAWFEAICSAIDHIEHMKVIAKVSQRQLRDQFSLVIIRKKVHEEIDTCIDNNRKIRPVRYSHNIILEKCFDIRCRWHQFSTHVYREGVESTLRKIIHH